MSDRDRNNPYDRSQQHGDHHQDDAYNSPRQANQWQGDSYRQQGGDWQNDTGQRGGGSDDYTRDYRFSGQGSQSYGRGGQNYGSGHQDRGQGGSYRSQMSDDDLRNDQRQASRNYAQSRENSGSYGSQDRNRSQGQYGQRGGTSGYAGTNYDASGGNDFGSFTSEDYGGRDFSNRGGSVGGGARSSESYRPSYGLSSWLDRDNNDRTGRDGGQSREDYGSWRQYGESRGFFAKAGDEIASWFGDEDASRRRDQDHRQDQQQNRGSSQSYGQGGSYGQSSSSKSHRGRGPSDYVRSDERIREDANDHLTHDDHVDASNITVSVKDGELTLNGTVESRGDKRRAEDCVEHISGVKHVQNNLRVQEQSTSSSYAASGGGNAYNTSGSSSYGHSGTSGLTSGSGSTTGLGSSTSTTGTGTGGTGTGGTGTGGSTAGTSSTSGTGSSASSTSSTGGANTTEGIGSTATTGIGSASTTRSSDKSS